MLSTLIDFYGKSLDYGRMNEQLVSQVEDLGLSNKEARVFVANLMLGPATVQRIGEFSGIKRVTTYVILESLVGLGLASQINKGKKTYFIAEDPVKLRRLLEKKEQSLQEQQHNFDNILPELEGLKNLPVDSPEVKYYDSAEGIRSVMNTFLSSVRKENPDMGYGFSNVDQIFELFPEFKHHQGNPDRSTDLPAKVIYTSKEGSIYKESDKQRNRQSRWVPHDKFPLSGDITMVGDHVVMLSLAGNKPMGITITSRELAKAMKAIFELAWDAAEQYNK